jgi:putative DNA primase/helicase
MLDTSIAAPSTFNPEQTPVLTGDRVCPAHLTEWVEGSAVSEDIARLNIESLSADELNERVKPKTPIQTGGWWTGGVNWRTGLPMGTRYGQAKPDQAHDLGSGKKAKYLTASGMEPDGIFLAMPDPNYWLDIWADKKQPILITEGAKKAGAGLSLGLPTIAVTGVWNWGKEGAIAPELEKWAQPGREVTLCFDSDYQQKPSCCAALHKLGTLLIEKGVKVKIAVWEEHKGMDDFIVAEGGEAFKQVVATADTLKQWEKQFKQEKPQKAKPPAANKLAKLIADKYREKLAWNIEIREWFSYGLTQPGIWEKEPKEAIEQVVRVELDAQLPDGYTHRQLTDILNLLKSDLLVKKWNQTRGLIPLQNGVLHKKTKKLSPHSPGYRLTYCLPFAYDPAATCEPIVNWLRETVGQKEELVTFLLVYLNAIVNQRADLQRYLELIGPGGTGKSTYMKLASYLIGERNVHTTKHQILEESRFETANLAGKLLTLITEADQYVGAVNVLKAITGQDPLHYEQKMKQAGEGFIYEGMVITAGNEPSRSTDYTSGLARRKIPVWFRNFIPSEERRDLDSEFKEYLPGLLNLVLTYSDEEVTSWLRNAEKKCPSLHEYHREMLCETNPIADWLDNKVLRMPGNRHTPAFLYNAHKAHCEEMGSKPMSQKRFSSLLIDLCQVQLGWSDVTKGRDRQGRYILGLALRPDGDFSPFPITEASDCVTDKPVTVTDSVTAETTLVYGCDGCDGFLDDSTRTEKITEAVEEKISCVNDLQNSPQPVTRHQPVTESVTPSTDELHGWENYHAFRAYPNPNSDNVRSSQKRALDVREAYRAAKTKEDLSALRKDNGGKFSQQELTWVSNWLKKWFPTEYRYIQATAKISQPSLLE